MLKNSKKMEWWNYLSFFGIFENSNFWSKTSKKPQSEQRTSREDWQSCFTRLFFKWLQVLSGAGRSCQAEQGNAVDDPPVRCAKCWDPSVNFSSKNVAFHNFSSKNVAFHDDVCHCRRQVWRPCVQTFVSLTIPGAKKDINVQLEWPISLSHVCGLPTHQHAHILA